MNNSHQVGNLMCLYVDEIETNLSCDLPDFLIKTSAQKILQEGGINWIPVIVKKLADSRYELIANVFVFAIALEAGLERIWCIIVDNEEKTAELAQILAKEKIPRINLSTASRDEIRSALEYLIEKPSSPLKGIKIAIATKKIDEAPRQQWKNLTEITKLKCGITRGKKLESLAEVFYLSPEQNNDQSTAKITNIATNDHDKNINDWEKLTVKDLKLEAKKQGLVGYSKMKKSELIDLLSKVV